MEKPTADFFRNSSGTRINTDAVLIQAIKAQHPGYHITTVPQVNCDLIQFASAGHASAELFDEEEAGAEASFTSALKWRQYVPPARRLDGDSGVLGDTVFYGKYAYSWQDHDFLLYLVEGRDGTSYYPRVRNQYVVGLRDATDQLVLAGGRFTEELQDEIWVFDGGFWAKDGDLWRSIQGSFWEDVILDEGMKGALRGDVQRFYDSREEYERLRVPWKRGIM